MVRLFRWLFRLVTGALVLAGLAALLAYWFAGRSIPAYDGRFGVSGIAAETEIVRDTASVPHIFGTSDADSFFGLGFVHAQDRLWQMTLLRRTAQGRLSEIFGARTLLFDDLLRRLDLYPLAVESVAALDPDTRAMLEAYARGVNAWLDEVNAGARGRGAPEFWLFPPEIAPWTPADSIAIVKLMALRLSGQAASEVLRARVSLRLADGARLADILPDAPGAPVVALPDYAALFPGAAMPGGASAPRLAEADPLAPLPARGMAGASNAWAAAPARSAAGGTLLANDPHLPFSAPSIWYLARMDLAGGGVIGGTIPGIPAILVGRSDRLAWGLTSASADDQDIAFETLDPDDPTRVLGTSGAFVPLRSRDSIIRVRGEAPRTITLRWSENGPILPGQHLDLGLVTPAGQVAALNWTGLSGQDTSLAAAIGIMRAASVDEALAAGRLHVAPAQNLTVVDAERIAMKTIGALPARDEAHQSLGRLPVPGWRPENRWHGRLDYAANPETLAPEGGILGNTNNKITDRPFPHHVSYDWGDTQRIQRWRKLMQDREVHTRDSFIEAQLDTVSVTARALLPLVGAELWFTGEAAAEGSAERRRQEALRLLADWNGEMNEYMPEPLIYAAWMRALQHRIAQDELGGDIEAAFTGLEPLFLERVFRDTGGAAVWCDVARTSRVEACAEMARLALDDALVWIGETHPGDLAALRWGDAHEARHDHDVLGGQPILRWLVNLRTPVSGGDFTLMRTVSAGHGPAPFAAVHGAGYRGVYDLADPDSSVFVIDTGQSGHPLSPHYDDLGERWRRGEYVPMSLDPALARAAALGTIRLVPRADADQARSAAISP